MSPQHVPFPQVVRSTWVWQVPQYGTFFAGMQGKRSLNVHFNVYTEVGRTAFASESMKRATSGSNFSKICFIREWTSQKCRSSRDSQNVICAPTYVNLLPSLGCVETSKHSSSESDHSNSVLVLNTESVSIWLSKSLSDSSYTKDHWPSVYDWLDDWSLISDSELLGRTQLILCSTKALTRSHTLNCTY